MLKKFDTGKPMVTLVDPDFTLGVAQVLTFGAEKYGRDNWREASPGDMSRYKDALYRHWLAYLSGELIDPESGLPHLDHIGCNTMFLRYFDAKGALPTYEEYCIMVEVSGEEAPSRTAYVEYLKGK